jgi:O-antigen/teichoic acid export membrane protein
MTEISSDARAAGRGGSALLIFQTAARALGLAFVVIVTRRLGPSEFGRYSTVASIVLMANFFADLGTSYAVTKIVSRQTDRADSLLSGTILGSLGLGVAAYAAGMIFVLAVGYPHRLVVDMALGGLAIPAASVASSVLGALDGRGLIARRAAVTLLQTTIVAVGGAVPILLGAGIRAAIVAIAVGPWVALVVASWMVRRARIWRTWPRTDWAALRELVRTALPFALIGAMTAFSARFDVVLLSVLRSQADTAAYDLAQRLLEALTYISAAICSPAFYILSRRLGHGDTEGAKRAFDQATRALSLIALPLSGALVILAEPAVTFAAGTRYHAVVAPFRILAAGQWLLFLAFIQMTLINAADAPGRGVRVALAATAVTVVVDAVLIPTAGPTGAAVAMEVSWVITVVAYQWYLRRAVGFGIRPPQMPIVLSAALTLVVIVILRHHAPYAILAGGATYGILLVLTRGVTGQDYARIRHVLRRPN